MRVISGSLRGRQFDAPKGHRTHPMGDKQRGALFNTLGDIAGLTVLDLYAGSGALGFEAISRGAARVSAVELDKAAQETITNNIHSLGVHDSVTLAASRVGSWSKKHITEWFDIVLCDPPYDRVLEGSIQKLSTHVARGGIMVLSWPAHLDIPQFNGLELIKSNVYANARLIFYKKPIPA
jgi:16S rRNA (guanine966-N2)-methyltransferase